MKEIDPIRKKTDITVNETSFGIEVRVIDEKSEMFKDYDDAKKSIKLDGLLATFSSMVSAVAAGITLKEVLQDDEPTKIISGLLIASVCTIAAFKFERSNAKSKKILEKINYKKRFPEN